MDRCEVIRQGDFADISLRFASFIAKLRAGVQGGAEEEVSPGAHFYPTSFLARHARR